MSWSLKEKSSLDIDFAFFKPLPTALCAADIACLSVLGVCFLSTPIPDFQGTSVVSSFFASIIFSTASTTESFVNLLLNICFYLFLFDCYSNVSFLVFI